MTRAPGPATPALARHTWADLAGRAPTVLLPLGSTEQHGPHLPVQVDTLVAAAVARRAAREERRRGHDVLVAPRLAYGSSGEHEGFPGTVSIGREALTTVILEYGRSACRWAGRLVVVNGHGGNLDPLVEAVRLLRREGRGVAWTDVGVPGADAHAGETETSLLLALAPQLVRRDLAKPGTTTPLAALLPVLGEAGVAAVAPTGVLGDPTTASASHGRALLRRLVRRITRELRAFEPDGAGRLRIRTGAVTSTRRVG